MPSPRHLYVHVPFCARRCSYCDFSIAVRRRVPVDEYIAALGSELRREMHDRAELDTLYFGGGTPSLLGGDGVARLIDLVSTRAALTSGAEVTLEANPDDVTEGSVTAWRAAGVNRVSLGAQTFDPRVLRWMHRTHRSWQVETAVERLRTGGIERLSIDLIFALPEALRRDWEADLRRAVALGAGHLSLYGLTIEPATPLARWVERGTAIEAPEERYEREFLAAHDLLSAAGYEHYEVSNYARPGDRSRHNSAYWSGVPYLGVGPSSHSFDGARRWWNVAAYAQWAQKALTGESTVAGEEELTDENLAAERIYLGLRTSRGLPVEQVPADRADAWVGAGWARLVDGRLRLTPAGWLRLDTLAADLTVVASR